MEGFVYRAEAIGPLDRTLLKIKIPSLRGDALLLSNIATKMEEI
jgi:hypothetical protein